MHERKLDDVLKHYGVKGMKWDEKLKSTVKKTKQSAMKIGSEAKESAMKIGSVASKEGKSAYQKAAPKVKKASVKVGNEAKELGNAAKIKALRAYDKVKPEPKRDLAKEMYRIQRTNQALYDKKMNQKYVNIDDGNGKVRRVTREQYSKEFVNKIKSDDARKKKQDRLLKPRSTDAVKQIVKDIKKESAARKAPTPVMQIKPRDKVSYTKIAKSGVKNVGKEIKYDVQKFLGTGTKTSMKTKPTGLKGLAADIKKTLPKPKKKTIPKKYTTPIHTSGSGLKKLKSKTNKKTKITTTFVSGFGK